MNSIDGNVAEALSQYEVNSFLEQVDEKNNIHPGGREGTIKAGYLVRMNDGIMAYPTHYLSSGSLEQKSTLPSQDKLGIEATFVYTGSFNPYNSEVTEDARNKLGKEYKTLVFNSMGDSTWLY